MTLDALLAAVAQARENGAAGADPVGFAVTEALARRAAAQSGVVQQRLAQRAAQRLALHALATPAVPAAAAAPAGLAALSALVDRLGREPQAIVPAPSPTPAKPQRNKPLAAPAAPLRSTAPAPLKAVTAFKGTWSRLRADQRLRQALAQVPAMAGPLNSSHLLNRTLQTLREISPAYLDAFMAQVDTLLWLEQASGGGELPARTTTPAEGGKRRGARKG